MYYPTIKTLPFSKTNKPEKLEDALQMRNKIVFNDCFSDTLDDEIIAALKYFITIKEYFKIK